MTLSGDDTNTAYRLCCRCKRQWTMNRRSNANWFNISINDLAFSTGVGGNQ
jgi:hypothetical protein